MPVILLTSVTSITIAFLSYIVVFVMNRRAKTFTWAQFMVLVLGVATDMLGTYMMGLLAEEITWDLHTISGYAGLVLMVGMAAFGLLALYRKNQLLLDKFGKYYFPPLVLWIVAYVTGVILGLQKLG